jgi:hypothetical protein
VPAAAVIPAPIAYIKVVAVKKLVVEFWTQPSGPPSGEHGLAGSFLLGTSVLLIECVWRSRTFTLKKLECLKQAYA